MDLRDLARDEECLVRIPGICNHSSDTVVLSHYRLAGTCGAGMKPPDTNGAYACSSCHAYTDSREGNHGDEIDYMRKRLAHAEGVMRTLERLHQRGYRMKKS